VLVIPNRVVPRLADLSSTEIASLFSAVQSVGKLVEKAYKADGLTIACQDGTAAGQTISHVHVHVIPRRFKKDKFEYNPDDIYRTLQIAESNMKSDYKIPTSATDDHRQPEEFWSAVDPDDARVPRTKEDMEKEAIWLKNLAQNDRTTTE